MALKFLVCIGDVLQIIKKNTTIAFVYYCLFVNILNASVTLFIHLLIYTVLIDRYDIGDCVNRTCGNGRSCEDGVNSYSCNCVT